MRSFQTACKFWSVKRKKKKKKERKKRKRKGIVGGYYMQ